MFARVRDDAFATLCRAMRACTIDGVSAQDAESARERQPRREPQRTECRANRAAFMLRAAQRNIIMLSRTSAKRNRSAAICR